MSSTNEIRFPQLVKICWKHVSVSQGPACSHSQKQKGFCGLQHDLSFSGCMEPKWYKTCTGIEENPTGQHMLEKHLNNHFLEQSSTWVSPTATIIIITITIILYSFRLGNGVLFKQCLDVSLKNHCQECL